MTFSMDPAVPEVTFGQIELYDRGVSVVLWRCTDGRHVVYGPTRGAALALLMNMRNTPQVITGEVLSAISGLVAYHWEYEKADYESKNSPEGHIFEAMLLVHDWLQRVFG